MKKKANALMLDELLRAHYKPLNLFTHKKFDTTDARGLPFSDKKEKVIWRRAAIKKVKKLSPKKLLQLHVERTLANESVGIEVAPGGGKSKMKKVKNDNRVWAKPTKTFTKEWSVVSTADRKGVAIKPKHRSASRYEVCVALRDNVLHINLYEDCAVFPLFEITKRVDGNWQVMRPIVGEYVSGKEYIVLTSNIDKIEVAEGE